LTVMNQVSGQAVKAFPSNRDQALENALLQIFFTDTIGSCHVENAVEFLRPLPNEKIGPVLRLVKLIAHCVSDLLAFSFMENVEQALEFLTVEQLEDWVTEALGIYEASGLHPAKDFFSNPVETTIRYSNRRHVATLEDSSASLYMLACGLSKRNIRFAPGRYPATDTETVWLPASFSLFPSQEQNRLFYRVATVHKCAQIRYGSFLCATDKLVQALSGLSLPQIKDKDRPGVPVAIDLLEALFPDMEVTSWFGLLETIRIEQRLASHYKGIARDIFTLKNLLQKKFETRGKRIGGLAGDFCRFVITDFVDPTQIKDSDIRNLAMRLARPESTVADTLLLLKNVLSADPGPIKEITPLLPYLGGIDIKVVEKRLEERRGKIEQAFVQILGRLLAKASIDSDKLPGLEEKEKPSALSVEEITQALAMVVKAKDKRELDEAQKRLLGYIQMQEEEQLFQELLDTAREIEQDLGQIPSIYVSSALDLATGLYDPTLTVMDGSDAGPSFSFYSYPEWDFRRSDYRQQWCTVKEMVAKESSGSFIADTLKRYKGQVETLRRQFEMIRQDYQVIKRQKDGQEVDIDAFVEAFTDLKAKLSPSEHLYNRLVQDRRDIAVLFLVDMSASTEGWINRAIKESLVLLATAMEYVGDQYAICGFSGMRRTGCQYFIIKEFEEEFSVKVKERITGIKPRDYTRMGPAIRHSIEKLKDAEARVKILLTLSDGKPEDYDEYKGPYAIEDTRMALFEARQAGIRPFCITVDKEARQYLPRMYGAANYVMVPDVRLLHKRVPEIYRILTT